MSITEGKPSSFDGSRDVKAFLTFTFKTTSKSRQQLYYEILSYLTEHPSGYNSQIAEHFNRSRQSVHVALTKLLGYEIIKKSGKRSSGIYYQLKPDVKNYIIKLKERDVKKLAEGVSVSPFSASSSPSIASRDVKDLSKSVLQKESPDASVYRLHRHTAYCLYVKGVQPKLSKSRFKNQERYLTSLSLPSGDWDIEFTKNYAIIRGPEKLGTLNEFDLLKEKFLVNLGEVKIILERRYNFKLDLEKVVIEQNNKFEIASQDPFCKWFATPYKKNNITVHERDFTIDASISEPEVDLIENWDFAEGVRKFQAMLDLSDNILPEVAVLTSGIQMLTKNVAEVQNHMEEKEVQTYKILKEISENQKETAYLLSDLKAEMSLTRETLREEISRNYIQNTEILQKLYKENTPSFAQKCDLIVEKLTERALTLDDLEIVLGQKKQGLVRYLSVLKEKKVITYDLIKTGKRGRPRKLWRMK